MKIHILYEFRDGAWGGGNQFFKVLRKQLQSKGAYTESIEDADIILFSSHHQMKEVIRAKMHYPEKRFVHRMGSVFTYARGDRYLDRLVMSMNENIADGTIFQSEWQRQAFHQLGMPKGIETVIMNAPDSGTFNTRRTGGSERDRIRIITTSWSTGDIKGFDIYEFLDKHLDFERYQLILLGNTKKKFKNIESFPPQDSRVVASMLKGSDLFITATQNDACSNSLLEALHCGLPVVARNSGGHPELVGTGGFLFNGTEDVLDAIGVAVTNLKEYRSRINVPTDIRVANAYYDFCWYILNITNSKQCNEGFYTKHNIKMKLQRMGELIGRFK